MLLAITSGARNESEAWIIFQRDVLANLATPQPSASSSPDQMGHPSVNPLVIADRDHRKSNEMGG
ncbi:MAG: hypothetical protein OSA48_02805 [Akkermansiaceae bacterium]|jgi:hypothetical protein|nr:hypothetical protein [Akkermansiaceae bacterium]